MNCQIKPLSCDPVRLEGLSEKLIVSHDENSYSGAVMRLHGVTGQLAALDFSKAPVLRINVRKREELIATNSMVLYELYVDGLGESTGATGKLPAASKKDFGSLERWPVESSVMGKAAACPDTRLNNINRATVARLHQECAK